MTRLATHLPPSSQPSRAAGHHYRRELLAALRQALSGPERLVTLTGPGGVGKTWLGRAVTDDLGRAFGDGTYVVELDGLTDPGLLAHTVAAGMGLHLHGGRADVSDLVPLLEERRVLLLLDRCEHLLPDCAPFVTELLRGCPAVHVLATSRQPLRVGGERVVAVPPLSVPDDPSTVDPLTALRHDGVALFVERATAVLPGFRLTEDNLQAVCALCARLDGNPLALELAAARAGLLSPQAILDRLDDRYRLLTRGARGTSARLGSLRACVEASWELCTDPERTLWARLSVFPADFDLDAAEEVCAGDGIEEAQVLDLVDSLLEKSVLIREVGPTTVRYRMPETLRAYGVERLGEDDLRRWSDRHLCWAARLVETFAAQWFGPGQEGRLDRLRQEQSNLRAALEKATREPAPSSVALRMVQALEPCWVIAGRITEARHWLAATLDHDTGAPDERTGALALAAWFATHQGDVEEAEGLLDEAARFLGAASSRARCLILRAQGGLAARRGDLDRADAVFTDLVDLALRAGRTGAAAEGWLLLALTRVLAGRTDDAERALRRCLTLADRAGDSQTRASALGVRALGALSAGETCTALTAARTALRSKVEIGDWFAVAFLLELVAWVALSEDDPGRAAVLLGAAARLWRQVGLTPASMGPLAAGRDGRLVAAREALGRRDFDRHLARGEALDLYEVLRYAEDDVLPGQPKPNPATSLTSRELAVAELVARGMSNRDIAAVLVISVHTVQGHVEKILRKLGFGSRAQVAAWVAHRSLETAR